MEKVESRRERKISAARTKMVTGERKVRIEISIKVEPKKLFNYFIYPDRTVAVNCLEVFQQR